MRSHQIHGRQVLARRSGHRNLPVVGLRLGSFSIGYRRADQTSAAWNPPSIRLGSLPHSRRANITSTLDLTSLESVA